MEGRTVIILDAIIGVLIAPFAIGLVLLYFFAVIWGVCWAVNFFGRK
jgi:hypothetical protein